MNPKVLMDNKQAALFVRQADVCVFRVCSFQSLQQRCLSQLSSPDSVQTLHRAARFYFKAHEKEAATFALRYYLANHKGISLQDATHISEGAPAFIRKLLVSVVGDNASSSLPPSTYIDIRLHVEAYLEKEGIDEVEPFLESIGLNHQKVDEVLPRLTKDFSGEQGLIKSVKVLTDVGISWKKVWNVFKNDTQLLDLTAEELSARIQGLEGLGFEKKDIAGLIQGCPSVLWVNFKDVMKPVMHQLEKLGVKQQIIGYLASLHRGNRVDFNKPNVQKIIETLGRCKLSDAQISEILGLWPQIIIRMSADELASKIEIFKGLKLTDAEIGRIFVRYPEILAASNKSSPSPKIQFLERLGFQRKEIGKLILRDPHIFHNCTENSLHPKIEYFESLGIDRGSLRKVITSFPALTGCSLELNLKPKIQFFESIGLKRESIANMVMKSPSVLALSVEQNLKPRIEFLEGVGVTKENISKTIAKFPAILYLSVEQNLKPKVEYLKRVGYDDKSIAKLICVRPSILGRSVDGNLSEKVRFLVQLGFDMGTAPLARALGYLFSMSLEALESRVHELEGIGLTKEEVRKIVRRAPGVLYLSKKQLIAKVHYLTMIMNYSVKELVKYPVFLDYSLDQRIKPRHRVLVWLKERGFLTKHYSFLNLNMLSNSMFVEKFVSKFPGGEKIYYGECEACSIK
ncbi:hypothetical protein O6H91_01G113800 [Diphasiastrum complanatum]|uniref:Uncharacterized protein n=1 Tax=Diphasiastrum complanatum TaxID=34168 RepID=A0ACC2EUX4_DIPCM|nr:hypothetical protein O6H91_01G113800 [Diphasiastrum complanatum]